MCQLIRKLKEAQYGYKVVAEKDGKYYSPATGIRYHSGKKVKIPKKQLRISTYFSPNILNPNPIFNGGFSKRMKGRTSILVVEEEAWILAETISYEVRKGYRIIVVHVRVRKNVMGGFYGLKEIYAGEIIDFIEKGRTLEEGKV